MKRVLQCNNEGLGSGQHHKILGGDGDVQCAGFLDFVEQLSGLGVIRGCSLNELRFF